MAVMFVAQPGLYGVFQLGRPDHHSLHMALAAWTLALLVRWCAGPGRPALAGWAGLSVALAMWVGTEALLILFVGAAGLGLLWLFGRAPAARALWRFAWVFAAGTLVAIAAERPPADWLAVELDRISLMHGVLAVAVAAGAGLIALAARRHAAWGWGARLATAVVAAAIPALAMAAGFPEFFHGPYGAVASEVREVFLANVVEAEPLLARGAGTWSEAVFALGPIVFAIPYALWRTLRGRSGESDAYLILLLALAVYIAGALVQIRLMPYGELAMVWLWAAVVVAAIRTVPGWAPRPWGSALAAGVLIVVVAGHLVAASLLMSPQQRQAGQADEARCDWPAVARYLKNEGFEGSILSYIYPGPELAWRTDLGVVAAPYHRNEAGILDAHRAFLATPDEALPIIEARRIGLIVLCDVERGRGGHDWYVTAGGPDSLYGRLAADRPPSWARQVGRELPELSGFQVFTVDPVAAGMP
jgi:hypothetical protein